MTVPIRKTRAETAFAEHFAAVAEALPGGEATLGARRAAMARFEGQGLPHRRIEAWKYTDLRNALRDVSQPAMAPGATITAAELDQALGVLGGLDVYRVVLVNGFFDAGLSTLPELSGVKIRVVADSGPVDDREVMDESIVMLNTAFVTAGLAIELEAGALIDKPVMVISVRAGGRDLLVTTRLDVTLGAGAQLTLIEAEAATGNTGGQANALVNLEIGDGAGLDHIKAGSGVGVAELATWRAVIGAEARYRAVQLIPGAPLARNQVFVRFEGAGSALDFASAVLGNGRDHIDSTIVVDHRAPGCKSRELFKGVLDDHARGVAQGKVIVQRDAQKTDGKQMAQALLLSETCEFDSKPELEIYADDVACGHGSTSAEIDPELVFYCRSRGIPESAAKGLLTEAFIAEVFDKVEDEALREALRTIARRWLAANHAA